jgi:hypothetical protein
MPLKLNVGLNRKIGEANYGSRGACVNIEVEVEPSLVEKPDQLRERVRYLFQLAKASVEEELNGHGVQDTANLGHNGDGHASTNNTNGNGNGHQATDKQLDYARQLANQISGLGIRRLDELTNKMFSKPITELTTLDASGLIDMLKQLKAGDVDLAAALNGAAL